MSNIKYVRTKDGAIYKIENGKMLYDKVSIIIDMEQVEKDYKVADTIEELCDRFVAETCDNTKFWVETKLETAKMYCGIKNIFGAIWTSKGLIYVAKLNENGELVLI